MHVVWIRICAAFASILAFVTLFYVYPQAQLQVGYATVTASGPNRAPVGTALFAFTNSQGILVWEAGVGATEAIRSGRIFVDEQGTQTVVALVNPSAQTVTVELILRHASGLEVGRRTLTFGPRQKRAEYVNNLFPLPAGFTGSLTFEGAADQRLAAITLRQSTSLPGEFLFATLPVIDLSLPATRDSVVFPHIGAGGILSTQIVLVSRSNDRVTGRIQLFSSNGTPLVLESSGTLASQFPYQIEPHGTFRLDLTRSGDPMAGYAVVTLEQGSATPSGSALFQFRVDGNLVSEAGVGAIAPTRAARIFVDTVGTQTGVAIASPGNPATAVDVELLDRNGNSIEKSSLSLPAGGHLARFAGGPGGLFSLPEGFTGLMEISSPVPIVPITLKLTRNSRDHLILTTLPVADLSKPPTATSFVFPRLGFGPILGGRLSTRLILINADKAGTAQGSLAFFQEDGSSLSIPLVNQTASSFPYQIGPGAARQLRPGNTAQPARILLDVFNPSATEVAVNESGRLQLAPVGVDSTGEMRDDFDFAYGSLSPDVASVDASGTIRGNQAGFSTLTVSAGGAVAAVTITVVRIVSGSAGFEITGIAQDLARRLYLANTRDHTLLLAQDVQQAPSIYAGVSRTSGLRDDQRLAALFKNPAFLATNQTDGDLFVSDSANHAIRQVKPGPNGRVETLAGTGQPGSTDGPLNQATFNNPQGIVLDTRGNLWIADSFNHTIRKINLVTKTVQTIAGRTGTPGLADGTGDQARFNSPVGIALETESLAQQLERERKGEPPPPISVIVADSGNGRIRRVKENGQVETLAVTSQTAGALFKSDSRAQLSQATGPAIFNTPTGVAVDPFGNIYVTETASRRVRIILQNGSVVPAAQANTFSGPRGIVVNQSGKVLIAESNRAAQEISFGQPSITSITPDRISNRGRVTITIRGKNFAPDTLVVVAGTIISGTQLIDTQTISFTAPPLRSGRATLTVQNRGGLAQAPFLIDPVPLNQLLPGQITTIAGGSTFSGDGSPAVSAPLSRPEGITVDAAGNLLIADAGNHRIRKVDAATGVITTVAGDGTVGFSGDNGPATAATLNAPFGVAIDAAGNLFIADTGNGRVRKVDAASGNITTFAGSDRLGFSGDNESATRARLNAPRGLALDAAGNLYIADSTNHRVRKVTASTGIIVTVAGNGQAGFSGDNMLAVNASLNSPQGVTVDAAGNLFIGDRLNHRVRKVEAATGLITTVAGSGQAGFSGDGQAATIAALNAPRGVAVDASGNLFIADSGNSRIRRVDRATGVLTTVAGGPTAGFSGDGGPASGARLNLPFGVTLDGSANLIVADRDNNRVRRIAAASGIITTVAGSGLETFVGDNGPAAAANLKSPRGLALDAAGNLFIADSANHRIRRVSGGSGTITTVAGTGTQGFSGDDGPAIAATLNSPNSVAVDTAGNLYISDTDNHRIRKVDRVTGTISTIAGTGIADFSGDNGQARAAALRSPLGIAFDGSGNLFVADSGNHRIRKVAAATGVITTIAGVGEAPFSGDNGPAVAAALSSPRDVALDAAGNVFIADTANNRIRKVDAATGRITTVAGNGQEGFAGDNGPALAASLNFPLGLALDGAGNLFIAETLRIRKVALGTGIITTVAGNGQEVFSGDNAPAIEAALSRPAAIVFDRSGNLFFADFAHNRVRAIRSP